jgi:phosphoglycolate phosphatase-like HAD superfamily hydrolase
MMDIARYKTWLFDCDGVLLESNFLKSQGFYDVTRSYGVTAAEALRDYHQQYGGVSRYEKMRYFITDILKQEFDEKFHKDLVNAYGNYCYKKMIEVKETPSLRNLLEIASNSGICFVVSGGKENELQKVFAHRGLDKYFKGIFGSPRDKMEIVSALVSADKILFPAVFVGDSRYDYSVAEAFGLDFVFMTQFSEFTDWQRFFNDKDITIINTLTDMIQE